MTIMRSRLVTFPLGMAILVLLVFVGAGHPRVAHAGTTFNVNSTGDAVDFAPGDGVCETATLNGICTLRAAIMEANAFPGTDAIHFAIPNGGVVATISPTTYLPFIIAPLTIDGSTQCCFAGIQLSGLSCPGCPWGLGMVAPSTVKGMVINDFSAGSGIVIAAGADGSSITSNYVGTNTTASSAKPNAAGVIVVGSSSNSIGPYNTISGNSALGVWITSCPPPPFSGCGPASSNVIVNNAIGTNGCCSYAVPNGIGVEIDGTSTYGTALAVSGNKVGVAPSGGNTIAGNTGAGVQISGSMATGNSVEANIIGNGNGVTPIANGGAGVCICGASNNVVGPNNNIAGNALAGVLIKESGGVGATGNSVKQSGIGFDGSATGALPNGGSGIEIDGTGTQAVTANTVGCAVLACGIGIGGNAGHGVYIHGAMASGNFVHHASIGESCPGDCYSTGIAIPDGGHGVYISGGAHDNIVGAIVGVDPMLTGNDIAYNHGAGVAVDGGGTGNHISGSTIHNNDGLGIDLDPIAPIGTAQNAAAFAPYITRSYDGALTSALFCPGCASGGGLLSITGYSHGAPPGQYFVDIYRNVTCDPSGYGEGALPLGLGGLWYVPLAAVTTDANGNLSGAGSLSNIPSPVGQFMTSSATRIKLPDLSPSFDATTEFGPCLLIKQDTDGDGVEDSIDTGAGCFSDGASPKPTFGCIVDRNTGSSNPADDCYVSVVDLPPPDGVVLGSVCPASPGASTTISMCGLGTVTLTDGGSQIDTCGSFRSGNLAVPADFDFSPTGEEGQYVLHQVADTESIVADLGTGPSGPAFSVLNFDATQSHYPVDVKIGTLPHHVTLPPDASMITTVLSPQKFRVENTASAAAITVDGKALPAGQMTTMITDVDGDGCHDLLEPLLVPPTSPSNPWDFFSVPVPALFAAPDPTVVFKDGAVTVTDAQSVFAYFKKGAHTGTLEYEQDLNLNGIKDGIEYDRTVVGPGQSGPPDGTVSVLDAQLAFAQFKRAYHC